MARGKKAAQELTPEEKLAQVLVPVEEQPYQIPDNWCWIHLPEAFTNHTDSKKKIQSKAYLSDGKYSVVDQGQELIGGYTDDKDMLYSGKLPVIIFGDHTRCVKLIDFPFVQGADGVKVLRPKDFYDINAFYYSLRAINIPNLGYRRHFPLFSQFAIPLPPLNEQQRIVDRIESIFAKLDEAKEKAQAVVDGFELRKSAILHRAFTGELTAKWREEHGVTLDRWTKSTFSDVVDEFKYGLSEKSDYGYDGIPVFRIPNVTDNGLSFDDLKYLSHSQIDSSSLLRKDDVLIIRSNGSKELVGKSVLVPSLDKEYTYASFLIRARLNPKIVPAYFVYYINSSDARIQMFKKAKSSAGINNINSKELGAINILVCSVSEQSEIIRILDALLAKENAAKEAAESVLDQIDTMKKAVLARAFRGELGTNDPTEESAVELLKTML